MSAAPASASGESGAGDAAKTGTPDRSANLTLANIKLGAFPEYSRLVFTFNRPLSLFKVQRAEVDELRLHFGPVAVQKTGRLNLNNQIVRDVALIKRGDLVVARVKMKTVRFDFRHFTTPDRKAVIPDLRSILTTTDDEAKAECCFYTPGEDFSDKFLRISSTFREALTEHPKPGLAPLG